jgi:protein TonB
MNKRLLIFIFISLIIHFLILAQLTFENKGGIKKDQPIMVDILKKMNETEKPPVNSKILSDKDLDLKKKTENKEHKNENNKPVAAERDIGRDTLKNLPKQSKQLLYKKNESVKKKNVITQKRSPVAIPKKNDENKTEKKQMIETNKENKSVAQPINKGNLEKILNPSDILSEIAKNDISNVKEGEDEVNIEAMKFKYYSYFYKFKRLLYQVWEYPSSSIYNGEEGVVRIRFSVLRDGKITNIRIVESSGYPDLDSAAVRALKTMKGLPLPNSYKLNILHVDGYFAYNIYRMRIY